jgi:RES domain-containing protein
VVGATIPDSVVVEEAPAVASVDCRAFGDRWITSLRSAVLRVRSAVVPHESNYLLNPLHADAKKIVVELPVAFTFDARLFGDSAEPG